MTRGGQYRKGIEKQQEILEVALTLIAERGYNAATIRELADAVGLSKTGLLHHFGTKEELFREVLERRDMADEAYFRSAQHDVVDALPEVMNRAAGVPGLIQLYIRFNAEATSKDHEAHEYVGQRYLRLRTLTQELITTLQSEGLVAPSQNPATLAAALVGAMEGLELQWLYDPTLDMKAALRSLFDAIVYRGPDKEADGTETPQGAIAQ